MAGPEIPVREFVSHLLALAATDSARAWLTAMLDAASHEVTALPDHAGPWAGTSTTLVTAGHHGWGDVAEGRLTGRWTRVVGARYADWLVLPAHNGSVRRILVARDRLNVDTVDESADLATAGLADVTASGVTIDPVHVLPAHRAIGSALAATGAAAVVVGSAQGLWRRHVEGLRAHLAASYGELTDSTVAQVARAASDIDAAELQITELSTAPDDVESTVWVCRQVVDRARSAADRLLEHSRHALDATDPVTRRWRDVDAGTRLAVRIFNGLMASLR